jgi:hypothetical protein
VKTYYSSWATSGQPISSWAGSPKPKQRRGKIPMAQGGGACRNSAAADDEVGRGLVGEHASEAVARFWGGGEVAHPRSVSTTAGYRAEEVIGEGP